MGREKSSTKKSSKYLFKIFCLYIISWKLGLDFFEYPTINNKYDKIIFTALFFVIAACGIIDDEAKRADAINFICFTRQS